MLSSRILEGKSKDIIRSAFSLSAISKLIASFTPKPYKLNKCKIAWFRSSTKRGFNSSNIFNAFLRSSHSKFSSGSLNVLIGVLRYTLFFNLLSLPAKIASIRDTWYL